MRNFTFYNPVRLVFGKGSIAELHTLLPRNASILLLYGGGSIKKNGVYGQVAAALKHATWAEFSGIEPNPKYETIMKAVALSREKKIDFILAVGGGSVIDAAKFMAAAIPFKGEEPWDIMAKAAPIDSAVPIGCVLTLAATGTEMNRYTVISRESTCQKLAIHNEKLLPQFSILDPETTYTLPMRQVINGIVDSWMHTCEQYLTFPVGAPLQDRQAEAVLQTILEEAPKVLKEPTNYDVRASLMWCATQAFNGTLACGTVSDWATHRIGHELTALFGVDHAQSLAIMFPAVMRHQIRNKQAKLAQYGRRVFGIKDSPERTAELAIDRTVAFFHSIGMKTHPADYGIQSSDYLKIVKKFNPEARFGEHQSIAPADVLSILELCR